MIRIKEASPRKEITINANLSSTALQSISAFSQAFIISSKRTLMGEFDSSKGDLRLVGVTAGIGGRSYMDYRKVPYLSIY